MLDSFQLGYVMWYHVTWPGSAGIEQHQQLTLVHSSARCFSHSQGSRQDPARLTLIFRSAAFDLPRPSCPLLRPPRIPPSQCHPTWSPPPKTHTRPPPMMMWPPYLQKQRQTQIWTLYPMIYPMQRLSGEKAWINWNCC